MRGIQLAGTPAAGPDGDAADASVAHDQLPALGLEVQRDAGVDEMALDSAVYLLGALGSQMPYGAVDELQTGDDGAAADFAAFPLVAEPLDMLVRTERKVHAVDAVDGLLDELLADKFGQVAAHLARKGELAVGKRARARKARRYAAGLAAHATADAALGARARFDGKPPVDHGDACAGVLGEKAQCAEDARRARPDDQNVRIVAFGLHVHRPPYARMRASSSPASSPTETPQRSHMTSRWYTTSAAS